MLDALKFVKGAIPKRGLVPELVHYLIKDGRIVSFNGRMALCSPVDTDLEACPHAESFYKAIEACTGSAAAMKMLPSGRLQVSSGRMRANVQCLDKLVFEALPQGSEYATPEGFLTGLATVAPFMSEDASRPWTQGILFTGTSMMATNNVQLVEYWLGAEPCHPVVIPHFAVNEILRIKEVPHHYQTDGHSLTVHYASGKWLRTQLIDEQWPMEVIDRMFSVQPENLLPLPELLAETIEQLVPFTENKSSEVFFNGDEVSTSPTKGSDDGVHFEVPGAPEGVAYNIHQLRLFVKVAKQADMVQSPCVFYGDRLRGVMVGIRR